jgi:Lyzozyme M1 (1,4-beta-N-acetylmuramidase)
MNTKGIDVSQWQGNIDFTKVKAAGYKFVIIRCNNWDNNYNCVVKDIRFEDNYRKAKAAGLDVGTYYYTWYTDAAGAKHDAELCKEYIKGKTFEYPIYFDLEWQKAFARGKAVCSEMVKIFCDSMEKAGYFAGLYISRSPLQQYITADVASRYALWIAEYGSKCNYNGTYGMWQYTSEGSVPGIQNYCDLDVCYVDYPKIIKEKGLNSYPMPLKPTPKPILDKTGFENGDKDLGVLALKQLLSLARDKGMTSANFDCSHDKFAAGTEKAVNDILTKWGYQQNGVAGEKFIRKLANTLEK